jgi:hypothetical protein
MNHKSVKRALGLAAAVVGTIGTMMLVPAAANAATAHPVQPWPPGLTGKWKPSGPGPNWDLSNDGIPHDVLTCSWDGAPPHEHLHGDCVRVFAFGNNKYQGDFQVTEGSTTVTGDIKFDIDTPNKLTVHLTPGGGKEQKFTLTRQ